MTRILALAFVLALSTPADAIGRGRARSAAVTTQVAWTPLAIRPLLYLTPSRGTFLSGASITSMASRYGSYVAGQLTGTKQPTLVASDSAFGGRPSVSFDGGDCLTVPNFDLSALHSTGFWLVAVDTMAGTTPGIIVELGIGAGQNGAFGLDVNDTVAGRMTAFMFGNVGAVVADWAEPLTGAKLIHSVFDYTAAPPEITAYVDGQIPSGVSYARGNADNASGTVFQNQTLNIGSRVNATQFGWTGRWPFLLMPNGMLSAINAGRLYRYSVGHYRLAIP